MELMKYLVLGLCLSISAGCKNLSVADAVTYTVNVATIANSIGYLDANIDHTLESIYDAEFYTAAEEQQIDALVGQADQIIKSVEKIIDAGNTKEALLLAADMDKLIADARFLYGEIARIVKVHYADYDAQTRRDLKSVDDNLKALDRAWRNVVIMPDGTDATPYVRDGLKVIGAAVRLLQVHT